MSRLVCALRLHGEIRKYVLYATYTLPFKVQAIFPNQARLKDRML